MSNTYIYIYISHGFPARTAQPEQGAVEVEILEKMELALDEFSKLEVDAEVGFYSAYYKSGEMTMSQRFNTVAQAMKWLLSLSHSHKSGNLEKGLGMAQKAVAMEVALAQKTSSLLEGQAGVGAEAIFEDPTAAGTAAAGTEVATGDDLDITVDFLTISKTSGVDMKKSALMFHKGTLCTVEAAAAKNPHLCIVLLGKAVSDKIYVLNTDT